MEEIRARVDSLEADAATADALKPRYRQLCKRPAYDEYLQFYNNLNTRLIDDGKGATEITPTGVVVGDTHYELDRLARLGVRGRYDLRPTLRLRDDRSRRLTLTEHWLADGMRSLHGRTSTASTVRGGLLSGTNLISNVPHNPVEWPTVAAKVKPQSISAPTKSR